jgi:hypothetical protein
MTCELTQYQSDGANFQAKSVLAAVQYLSYNLEGWKVTRWENGREDGYTVFKKQNGNQLNITFCEARNTDCIILYCWDKWTYNAPTLFDITSSDIPDAWMDHITKSFNTLEVKETSEYIIEMMKGFEASTETDPNQS